MKRRKLIKSLALGGTAATLPLAARTGAGAPEKAARGAKNADETRFRFSLNTSTLSGQNPGLEAYVDLAGEAGYDGIEVWVRDVEAYRDSSQSLSSLRRQVEAAGLRVESAIGFAPWMQGGEEGMQQMEKEMRMLAEIGCKRIAAPPAGVPAHATLDLFEVGRRYRQLLDLGRQTGVMPQLEFWGSSPVLWHLGQVLMIAAVANDPDARILPDIYHLFRGGSGFEGLKMLNGKLIDIFHMNDYPGNKSREEQSDADRVFPGEGAAPMEQIMGDLKAMGGEIVLSLELFNRGYWERDMGEVAQAGLQKMKEVAGR